MNKLLKILFSLFISIILLFAFALPLNPAGNWYQQFMPNIGGRTISDITFIDSLTGWAVTPYLAVNDTSFVLKTSNGGNDWFIQHTRAGQFVGSNRVHFLNANTGFTAGVSNLPAYSAILKTTDGGNTWSNVNPPTDPFTARDISILNSDTIWVVSDNSLTGGVFFTSNGGGSWQQQLNLNSNNPDKVYFYNGRLGFISTSSGGTQLYRTTNSGMNWNVITGENGFTDMYFIDSLTGWRAFATMKKTTNGGLNWVNQVMPFGGNIITTTLHSFSNINRDTIWGCGGAVIYPNSQIKSILYRTVNGGTNWLYQIPDTAFQQAAYRHIKFIDRYNGWVYGMNQTRGIHTSNGGDTTFLVGLQQVSSEIPKDYNLFQNYPNPFNPKTIIKYQVTKSKYVNLAIYDVTGKQIIDLVNRYQTAGTYEVDFSGAGYSSGVYFYSLLVDGKLSDTKKMLMVK